MWMRAIGRGLPGPRVVDTSKFDARRDHHPYAPYNIPGENVFWDGSKIHGLGVDAVGAAVERLVSQYGLGGRESRNEPALTNGGRSRS